MEKKIIYDNRSFTLGTAKRYYYATVNGKTMALHRYIYTKFYGAIPDGWHIHHKDENVFNNDRDNLEALPPKKHYELHKETSAANGRKNIHKAIAAAPVWHSSDEGIKWHHEHYEQMKHRLHEVIDRTCDFCNAMHQTTRKKGNAFCSNKCKSAWRRKNKPDKKIATCPTCLKDFETLKYLPNTYCSRQCKPAPNPKGRPKRSMS